MVHREIKLVKAECLDNWYTIEWAEHDGRAWFEPTEYGGESLHMSCRISDACVEGSAEEMIEIAKAIQKRGTVSFRRCAILTDINIGTVEFWSPRNSDKHGIVTQLAADNLAEQILRELVVTQ